jgi:hypothetical protein
VSLPFILVSLPFIFVSLPFLLERRLDASERGARLAQILFQALRLLTLGLERRFQPLHRLTELVDLAGPGIHKRRSRRFLLCFRQQSVALQQQGLTFGFDAMPLGSQLLALGVEALAFQHTIRFGALALREQLGFETLTLRIEQRAHTLTFGVQIDCRTLTLGIEEGDASLAFSFDVPIRFLAHSHSRERR